MNNLKNIIINNLIKNNNIPSYIPEPLFYPFRKVDTYKVVNYKQFNEHHVSILISSAKSSKLIYIRISSDYGCVSVRLTNEQIFNIIKNNFNYDYYKKTKKYYYIYMLDCNIKKYTKEFINILKKEYILI